MPTQPTHRLLQRQLKRCFGEHFTAPPEWSAFIGKVDAAYMQADQDRTMLERSLDLSSQELLLANSELRAVFEAIPDLLFRVDWDGIILSVKGGSGGEFTIPPGNLRGRRIQEIFEQAVGALFQDALGRAVAEQKIGSFEYSLPQNARRAFYEARVIPRANEEIVVIIRDITARKADELEIARLNRLYALLSAVNQAVLQAKSPNELLGQVCRVAAELGRLKLAWIGWHDSVTGSLQPVARAGDAIAYLDEIEVSADISVPAGRGPAGTAYRENRAIVIDDFLEDERTSLWRDSARRHGLASGGVFPIRQGGAVAGVLFVYADTPGQFGFKEIRLLCEVADDISFALDHLAAEASRRQMEQHHRRLATIVDSSHDAIVSRSLDNVILTWNRGAAEIYGYSDAEVIGRPMDVLIPPGRVAEFADIDTRLRRGDTIPSLETVRRRKDGREIHVSLTVSALRDAAGHLIGAATIARDITEQKELAAQVLRTQRLESIGKLASGLAHDLNNILTPIMMGVPLLRYKATDSGSQALLDTIEASVSRGAQVIRHILLFARGADQTKGPTQTQHLAREIADMLEQTLQKSVGIQGNFPRDLWPIEMDATQFHQVLMNLCVNARDAMPKGGVLTLSGENVDLDATEAGRLRDAQPGRYVAWSVADTGEGISPENIERIFEPFFTTKAPGKGTGLGLYTVRSLIRESGGFMDITSRLGEGTRFRVFLPAVVGPAALEPALHPLLKVGNGETVLLVDDEFSVLQMIEQVLTAHNYKVITAESAATALVAFRSHERKIALLLTDLIMPGMSGAELIRQLRSRNPALKVIAISGLLDRDDNGASQMDVMADVFFHKPFTMEKLLSQIAAVLHEAR
jgi:PAS domain S-box-containing protein